MMTYLSSTGYCHGSNGSEISLRALTSSQLPFEGLPSGFMRMLLVFVNSYSDMASLRSSCLSDFAMNSSLKKQALVSLIWKSLVLDLSVAFLQRSSQFKYFTLDWRSYRLMSPCILSWTKTFFAFWPLASMFMMLFWNSSHNTFLVTKFCSLSLLP